MKRYQWGAALLLLLVAVNVFVYWPGKKSKAVAGRMPLPPGEMKAGRPPEPTAEMKARFEAMLAKMSEAERKAFAERRKADEAFFESLKNLSETERRQKMEEHRAANPPPPMPGGGPGGPPPARGGEGGDSAQGGGKGGPGDGKVRIPPADARRNMDQQIVNSQGRNGS